MNSVLKYQDHFANFFFQKKIIFALFVFQFIFTYTSIGYLQADEHYQIIEFLNYKLGNTNNLSWEFHAKIRPWTQIYFYFLSYKFVHVFLPDLNPFAMMTIFRMEAAFISLGAKLFFLYSLAKYQKDFIFKWTALILCFFWLFPYLAARTSSENFSSSFILLAFGVFLISIKKPTFSFDRLFQNLTLNALNIFVLGLLFGVVFQLRYQCLFVICGASLWMLLNMKKPVQFLIFLGLGFTLVFCLGILIDKWGYDTYQITAYKYFDSNILQGIASKFGVKPWYWYIPLLMRDPIFGPIFVALFLVTVFKYPKNFFVWSSILFVVVHSIIAHKEVRFLFPVLIFMYIPILNLLYELKSSQYFRTKKGHNVSATLLTTLIVANTIFLTFNFVLPTHASLIKIVEFLQTKMDGNKLFWLNQTPLSNTTHPEIDLLSFYSTKKIELIQVDSWNAFENIVSHSTTPTFLYLDLAKPTHAVPSFLKSQCQVEYIDHVFPKQFVSYDSVYKFYVSLVSKNTGNRYLQFLLKKWKVAAILKCQKNIERASL